MKLFLTLLEKVTYAIDKIIIAVLFCLQRAEHQKNTREYEKNADKYQSSMISLETELHVCSKGNLLNNNY